MSTKNIIFIDSRVSNPQSLIDSLTESAQVFVLNSESDGLGQMANLMQGQTGIDVIHVISHGSQGALYLGSTVLNSGNLGWYAKQLGRVGNSLTPMGDILLYGCNVAQGDAGLQFITALAQATGADVAASTDATGVAALGGDGVLEQVSGSVDAASLSVDQLTELLAVNTAPTFATGGGKVITDFGLATEISNDIAVQLDGKFIVVGGPSFLIARYNIDGSLDTTFDGDGKISGTFNGSAEAVAVETDGNILVAGSTSQGQYTGDFALARYKPNGVIDTSFGSLGLVITSFKSWRDVGAAIAIQQDGKILVAGMSDNGSSTSYNYDFAIVRYNSNGSLDTSFGSGGKVTTEFGNSRSDQGRGICIQPDGKIIVSGTTGLDFAIVRYNYDGTLDTEFDGDGRLVTPNGGGGRVALQNDGKILLAGYDDKLDFVLYRYNNNGSFDPTFGNNGKVKTNVDGFDFAYEVVIQQDNKILLVGDSGGYPNGNIALVRYHPNGSLDTTFSGDGKVTTDFGAWETAYSLAIQSNGKILVAGTTNDQINSNFAVVRYNSDGSLDTEQTFTGSSANESFVSGPGNDTIDGGLGLDTAIFTGTRADHTITQTATGWTVRSTADGTDTLQNVERLQFSNETLALDINGVAGQAYRIYQAAFNRTPDNGGLKYWIGRMDAGTTQDRVAAEFVGSQEFQNLYGSNPSNADFLTKLYSNVLHRTPDTGGYNWWLGELDAGRYDKTSALASFAESPENQAGVIGVIQNGIDLFN